MQTIPSHRSQAGGGQNLHEAARNNGSALAAVIGKAVETREARHLLTTSTTEFLNVWAGTSWWKQWFSRFTGFVIRNQFTRPDDVLKNDEFVQLFTDEGFIESVSTQLPDLLDTLLSAFCAGSRSLEQLPTEDKQKLIGAIAVQAGQGKTGILLTSLARILNDIHKEDPEFFARTLEPGFKRWVESTDFGELKEALEASTQDAGALFRMVNNVMWKYPAKVVLLLSFLPSLANAVSDGLKVSLEKLNAVPPDLLADIVIAFIREIDPRATAQVVNELAEIGRKLSTGSALIGEPGAPLLPKVLAEQVNELFDNMDAAVFWKGRLAIVEMKAAFDQALTNVFENHPDFLKYKCLQSPQIRNIQIRSKGSQLSLWENLDDDTLNASVSQGLEVFDAQEAADVFNAGLRLFNRIWENQPEKCAAFAQQFSDSVDYTELMQTASKLFDIVKDDLQPVVQPKVPEFVTWVCESLRPPEDSDGEYSGSDADKSRARQALRSLLMAAEVN